MKRILAILFWALCFSAGAQNFYVVKTMDTAACKLGFYNVDDVKVYELDCAELVFWENQSGNIVIRNGENQVTVSDNLTTPTLSGTPAYLEGVQAACKYLAKDTTLPLYLDSTTLNYYTVLSSLNTPPGGPVTGATYLVGNSPTGAWAGHAKDVAEWNGSAWVFYDGVQGDYLYNSANAITYQFRSGNWVQTAGIPLLNNGNSISSGVTVGTNNNRSLNFETNNVRRGRFDSLGRFHVYNLPTSSASDTFVNLTDANGKFTKVGKSTFLAGISGGGGGSDSITRTRLYADLYNEWADSSLVPGSQYLISDFRTVYDQLQTYECNSSGAIGTICDVEPIIVTAVTSYAFDQYAKSLLFPKDIIRYDIGYQKTFINEMPAYGRIYYRQDSLNNSAWYDWRAIKVYNTKDGQQYYTFNALSAANSLSFNSEIGIFGLEYAEYPDVIFMGSALFNESNLITGGTNCPIDTNSATIFYGIFNQNSNCVIQASSFYGDVVQNTTMQITGVRVEGNMEFCQASAIAYTTFGGAVAKLTNSNIAFSVIGGQVDRCVNTAALYDTISGKFYWCNDVAIFASVIDGDFYSSNNVYWNNTDANCSVYGITGSGNTSEGTGFQNCTITGNSSSSRLQYINVQTLVLGKTIDEATYPQLFQPYPKTIFRGSDNLIYFSYYNGTTTVTTQIL